MTPERLKNIRQYVARLAREHQASDGYRVPGYHVQIPAGEWIDLMEMVSELIAAADEQAAKAER